MERQIQEYIEANRYHNGGISIRDYSKHMYGLFQWYSEYICFIISQLSMLSPSRPPDASCIRDAVKGIPCTHARVEGAIKIQWWKVAAVGCNFRNCDCPWLFFVLLFFFEWAISNVIVPSTSCAVAKERLCTLRLLYFFIFFVCVIVFLCVSPLLWSRYEWKVNILY